jgi:uncharacterized protein (DUF1800 family)
MKKITLIAILFCLLVTDNYVAQGLVDYFGTGRYLGVKVSTSSNKDASIGENTINGSGLDAIQMDASRFAAQATLGANPDYVNKIVLMGYERWIEDQFTKKPSLVLPTMEGIWKKVYDRRREIGEKPEDIFGPFYVHFNYAWWQTNMTNTEANEDLLRQRVATALSEIVVVSKNSDLGDYGGSMSQFYDILLTESFGNYKTLLKKVTKSLAMGFYLSHINNPKTNLTANIRPDENYAREIMQLFTIGLFKLNIDGTEKLGTDGKPIPTYDNNDIKEMSKIFTGLYGEEIAPCPTPCPSWWPKAPNFGLGPYVLKKTTNLVMANYQHEPGPKTMPDKKTIINIPNDGMAEIDSAINYLVNDPNTAPFISYRLIQQLVKSNPSPQYVARVANIFLNDGKGERGNLKAVVKAILLDAEARSTNYMDDKKNGKLRNPTLRYTHFARANTLDSDLGRYWNNGENFYNTAGHHTLSAPTVFNFYPPNHVPVGDIKNAGLVAPEFKVHNTSTSVGFLNSVHTWTNPWTNQEGESGWVMTSWEWKDGIAYDSTVFLSTIKYENITDNEKLIYTLNKDFAHGQIGDATLNIMRNIAKEIDKNTNINDSWWYPIHRRHKVRILMYFLFISPDYAILK